MHEIRVDHTFEAAHRLPHLPGKCESLHGHSWRVAVTVAAPHLDEAGIVAEFAPFKKLLRGWIDGNFDHGSILGERDPLVRPLSDHGCKVFQIAGWPTVESIAQVIGEVAATLLRDAPHVSGARASRVDVQETSVNGASWTA